MLRFRLIIGLVAIAALAFWLPSLLHKPAPRPHASITGADAGIVAAATPDTAAAASPTGGADGHSVPPTAAPAPVVLPGFTGAAKVAGQALLDKMLGKHNEMTRWAEGERTRIQAMEPVLQQLEQTIKEKDARGQEMSQRLEQMRGASRANGSEYDTLQAEYNNLVVERNRLNDQYDQQFAMYKAAVRDFDAKIADYEAKLHKALPVP